MIVDGPAPIRVFFEQLNGQLAKASLEDRRRHQSFFDGLGTRLEAAREIERELDRRLAQRFNVFDYIRTDELGLSRVIADLLDPHGNHGQGSLFLRLIPAVGELIGAERLPDEDEISVELERGTPTQRRIDVSVEMRIDGQRYCLAIENKPYTGDQKDQVKDYLEFLSDEYGENFILVYLSPKGDGPSEKSITESELCRWNARFGTMPYWQPLTTGPHESLADWFGECRRSCDVDRLRWFLHDGEDFCRRTFGGTVTSAEMETTSKFILSDHSHVKTAMAVFETWPVVRDLIHRDFLANLRIRIGDRACEQGKGSLFDLKRRGYGHICLRNQGWQGCVVVLATDFNKPQGWFVGVYEQEEIDETKRTSLQHGLKRELGEGEEEEGWPWWKDVDDRYGDWEAIVPELYEDLNDIDDGRKGGEITTYYVELFQSVVNGLSKSIK